MVNQFLNESIDVEKAMNWKTITHLRMLIIHSNSRNILFTKVMNSFSTYLPGNFGGLNGRTLQVNDTISWKNNVDTIEMMHFRDSILFL